MSAAAAGTAGAAAGIRDELGQPLIGRLQPLLGRAHRGHDDAGLPGVARIGRGGEGRRGLIGCAPERRDGGRRSLRPAPGAGRRGAVREGVRLPLELAVAGTDLERAGRGHPLLLGDVDELVCDEPPARVRAGVVATGAEHDVVAHRVRPRAHGLGGRRRCGVGVYLYPAEIDAEPRLHVRAERRLKRARG